MRLTKYLLLAFILTSIACSDTQCARRKANAQPHVIRLYAADGHIIEEWESTGRVECTDGGICDFMDSKTHKLVRTTGDIVVFVK